MTNMQIPNVENLGIEKEGLSPSVNVASDNTPEIETNTVPVKPVVVPEVNETNTPKETTQELPISVGYRINGEEIGEELGKIKTANLSREAINALAEKIKKL